MKPQTPLLDRVAEWLEDKPMDPNGVYVNTSDALISGLLEELEARERVAEAAERELAAAKEDAERWREHCNVQAAGRIPGALHTRMTMVKDDVPWHIEYILSSHDLPGPVSSVLGIRQVGIAAEIKYQELLAALGGEHGG